MPDFSDYFRNYQQQAQRPQPSRETIARAAVEKQARQMEAARGSAANILFRRTLAQAAEALRSQGRPVQQHYLGIPIGSMHTGPFYAGQGFTERVADGYGWLLTYSQQSSPQGASIHSAFLRSDGSGIIHRTSSDTIPVLPLDHPAVGVRNLSEDSPVVQLGGKYYLMESHRAGWQTGVTSEARVDEGFVVQNGELMRLRGSYDGAERYELIAESYAAELARLAIGGVWQ